MKENRQSHDVKKALYNVDNQSPKNTYPENPFQ
jgi:hypothetical protein